MNVEYAFLCDYAAPGPKLTAVGIGIDSIYAPTVPTQHPQLFAVLCLRFSLNETRRTRAFEMFLQDADGQDVIPPVAMTVEVPPPSDGMTYRTHRMVNGMYGLNFQKFGDYQVSWIMDGTEVHAVHFRVVETPAS
jgi:hypothetical protein